MGSTNTSHSVTLELYDNETGLCVKVPAFDSKSIVGRGDVYLNGIVSEERIYRMVLVAQDSVVADTIEVSINGGDSIRADVDVAFDANSESTKEYRYDIVLHGRTNRANSKEQEKLFFQTYGFARIELRIPDFGDYTTMDIPCACIERVNVTDVRAMLEALLDNDDQTIADWMFLSNDDCNKQYALLESNSSQGRSKSLASFIEVVQEVLDAYEMWLSYFRSNGHCTILNDSKRLPGFDVRQFGADEFIWLMRNADVLYEVQAETGLVHNGHNYFPRFIDAEIKTKSFDNYENSVVITFLSDVISSLKKVNSDVREGVELLQSRIARLDSLKGSHSLPALVVMEECASREISLYDHLESQRMRAQRLLVSYRTALPGAKERQGNARSPRRTKVFQEVRAYSTIFQLIEKWHAFGEFSLARESLALHALRLDKLYEYYALYLLLCAFRRNGYMPDAAYKEAHQRVRYTLDAPKFVNERIVNNLYHLKAGSRCVTLYYQPVIYGDARKEHGITFHKKSSRLPFAPVARDSYYLPDYMIVFENGRDAKTFMLDAKYSAIRSLTISRNNDWSRFSEAYFKYIADSINESFETADALWLLAGKEDIPGAKIYETASWIATQDAFVPSGIVPASPSAENLDELFQILGLIELKETPKTSDSDIKTNNTGNEIGELVNVEKDKPSRDTYSVNPSEEQTSTNVLIVHTEEQTGLSAGKTAIVNLIERLLIVHVNVEDLKKQRWCVRMFGVNSPVIRDRKPQKRFEARKYSQQSMSIGEVYVLVDWKKNQLNSLNRFLTQHEQQGDNLKT